MLLNKGITKTALIGHSACSPNAHVVKNEIAWNADYDGKLANLSVDINHNGKKKHLDMKLTNNDLSKLLSIPSIEKPLDKRLLLDYNPNLNYVQEPENQKIIIIPAINGNLQNHMSKPLIMPLNLKRSKSKRTKTHKSKSKSISNKSLKYRLLRNKYYSNRKKTHKTKSI